MDIDNTMRVELNKPVSERKVLAMVSYCEICNFGDCSQERCPLIQAKFKGKYIPFAEFAASQGVEVVSSEPVIPSVTPDDQLALF